MKLSMAMSGSMWLALRKAITWRPVISSMAPVRSACLLVGSARVEHEVCLAVADEAALALGQQICTTTVIRLSLKCVRALVGPRPVYSRRSRTAQIQPLGVIRNR
jgi:hypothetical protein